MPLETSAKRRSSVGILLDFILAPPSPTDSPGAITQADRQHAGDSYAGVEAAAPPPIVTPPPPGHRTYGRTGLTEALVRTPMVDRETLRLTPPWQRYFDQVLRGPQAALARTPLVDRETLRLTPPWQRSFSVEI